MTARRKSPKQRTIGLSRREYAKGRKTSETAIRRHIASGLLQPAILEDGSLDAAKADALLSRGRTRGREVAASLEEARRRKLAAQCALLADEVDTLRKERIHPHLVVEHVAADCRDVAERLVALVQAADTLARAEPGTAFATLDAATFALLSAIADEADAKYAALPADPEPDGPAFAELDGTQLAATKASLEAERLEWVRATARGDVILLADAMRRYGDRIVSFRARILSLPSRTAPLFSLAKNRREARAVVLDVLDEALAELAGDESIITARDLMESLRNALKQ